MTENQETPYFAARLKGYVCGLGEKDNEPKV